MLSVQSRGPNLERGGPLPVIEATVVHRNNSVSGWSVKCDGRDPRVQAFQEGWGVLIQDGDWWVSGPAIEIEDDHSAASNEWTVTIRGVSDETVLDDMVTIPNPAQGATGTGTDLWKASGPAETVIRRLVDEQIGPSAPADYRVPRLVLSPNQARGGTVSVSTRFRNLLEEVQEQASAGGLLFRVAQEGELIRLSFSEGRDLSRAVRLTRANGGVGAAKLTRTAPTVTEAIVGGVGSGATRKMWRVANDTAPWGRRVTRFVDRQSTADENELQQAAEQELEGGQAKSSVTFDANDLPHLKFGRDFTIGDTITVGMGGDAIVSDVLQIADVRWTSAGRDVRLQVGPVADESKLNQASGELVALVKKLSQQTRQLQTR